MLSDSLRVLEQQQPVADVFTRQPSKSVSSKNGSERFIAR
ncbi:hypothetical protein PPEP_a3934 [Pseudoalteromonas peptidolytica F12-50-A1]|uniref:Uncharacterized protein n=1 Tax=Pseudoalteromonas peptidolytica F12-50-A1 TaxID=1315280 RepID=A0A8I0MX49_9GAMM|nr:hypothetical protein [Pseudoalteromonas peptidolytica F12-50-A1]